MFFKVVVAGAMVEVVAVKLENVVDSVGVELCATARSELLDATDVGLTVRFALTVVFSSVARVVDADVVSDFPEEMLESAEVPMVALLAFSASGSSMVDFPEFSETGEDCLPSSDPDFSPFSSLPFSIMFSVSMLAFSLR